MSKQLLLFCTLVCISMSALISTNEDYGYNITESRRLAYYAGLAFCNSECLANWSCKWSQKLPELENVSVIDNNLSQIHGFIGYDPVLKAIVLSFRGSDTNRNWW